MFKAKRRDANKEFALNITSLMDILTIILIFLIISFDTEEGEVEPPKDFEIPASISETGVKLAVKVSIATDEVRVEGKRVVTLVSGQFRSTDIDASSNVKPLLKELKRQKAIAQRGAKAAPQKTDDEDETEIVYFEAAKGTRYDTVDRVLKTAAAAGFVKFRLAVQKKI